MELHLTTKTVKQLPNAVFVLLVAVAVLTVLTH